MFGEKVFGADPAGTGVNESVIVVRSTNVAEVKFASSKVQPIEFTGHCTCKSVSIKTLLRGVYIFHQRMVSIVVV